MSLSSSDLLHVILALGTLMLFAHAVGQAFAALRQPRVIGEIVGGLLLGPTVFGVISPDLQARVFPAHGATASIVGAVSQLGLLLLMYCSGIETRAIFRRGDERAVSRITLAGTLVPFGLGLLLVQIVNTHSLTGSAHSRMALVLVFALAIAVTSVPVISRIMFDLGVLHTSFARVVLGVAIVEDTVVYVVLAVALGLVAAASGGEIGIASAVGLSPGTAAYMAVHTAATLSFFAAMLLLGPRLLRWSVRSRLAGVWKSNPVAYQLLFLLLATLACVALGVTAMFGAFLAGIVTSSARGTTAAAARGAIKDFSFAFFIPVYFAAVGLQLDLVHHFDPLFFLWFTAFACVAKSLSVYVGSRLAGETHASSTNFAIAMNARGGPGIVLATVALGAGIINTQFYASLILLVIVSSQAAGAWLGRLIRTGRPLRDEPAPIAVLDKAIAAVAGS